MNRFRFSLRDRLTVLVAFVIFVCIAVFSVNSFLRSSRMMMSSLRENLKDTASALALSISPEEVETVLGGTDSAEAYWRLKRKLYSFTQMGDKQVYGAYILVMTPKKNIWQFVADDVLTDEAQMSKLHEKYDVSKYPEMQLAFSGPIADQEINQDKWGRWLSGYAPIYDRAGIPLAIFGVNMRAADVEALKKDIVKTALIYFLVGLIAAVALGRISAHTMTGSIIAIIKRIRELKANNYDARINIQRADELGDLINVVNEMADKLREVDKAKTDFLSVITDELYTPLTPIKLGAAQLKLIPGLAGDQKTVIEMIERQTQQLHDLIDEVLDFSWLDVQELKLNKGPVDLNALINDAQAALAVKIGKKDIRLNVAAQPGLPTIVADKKRLQHVMKVLLDNAVKFSPDKGEVIVRAVRTAGGVNVSVEDKGIGIAPENITRIFDRFFQSEDHLTREHGGLGLGLAIAKRIVAAHGGQIWAESPGPGQGSRFFFSLPIA